MKIGIYIYVCIYLFTIISGLIFLRMRNVSDKSCRKNQNTHFVLKNLFFPPKNLAVYGIMWKNIVQPDNTAQAHCILDN